jgi:hypothetical protein
MPTWTTVTACAALVVLLPAVSLGACNSLTGADDLDVGTAGAAPGGAGGGGGETTTTTSTGTSVGGSGGATSTAGSGGSGADPCAGVTCSSLGSCVVNGSNQAECDCNDGYHDVGLTCVVDESCDGVDCGRCSSCELVEGIATCTCPDDFVYQQGFGCTPSPDPCDGVECGTDQICISEHHCTPDAVCVDTCDCSNCGDCDMEEFVSSGAWALYCGGGESGPATVACTKPCPNGGGCIPYSTPICWGGQGCMSL